MDESAVARLPEEYMDVVKSTLLSCIQAMLTARAIGVEDAGFGECGMPFVVSVADSMTAILNAAGEREWVSCKAALEAAASMCSALAKKGDNETAERRAEVGMLIAALLLAAKELTEVTENWDKQSNASMDAN